MSGNSFTQIDWGQEWRNAQTQCRHVSKPEKWDRRAPSFGNTRASSPYVDAFVTFLDLQPARTVFDMGCGNGAIAIPLAQAGHRVIARDFSVGMLRGLADEAAQAGVSERIDAAQMSWEDDWEACGIAPRSVDVAFASRSIIVQDLADALAKLSGVARAYACISVSSGFTPKISPTILSDLGIAEALTYDDVFAFNILYQMGYFPEVSYIVHDRIIHFDDVEDAEVRLCAALEKLRKNDAGEDISQAQGRVRDWIEQRMQPNERAGQINHHGEIEGAYKVVVADDIRWTCIKWNV